MSKKVFNKEKKDVALKAISELCLHCKNHDDDCGVAKAEETVQTLHTEK